MRRITLDTSRQALGPTVTALGVFDGVHLGHQDLLADTVSLARSHGVPAAVLTFEPDPHVILEPECHPPRIMSADARASAISLLGIDLLVEVPFDAALAVLPAEEFLDSLVLPVMDPLAVTVGADFRFGAGASGDVSLLLSSGAVRGFAVVPRELTVVDDRPVTATRIRRMVADGRVGDAAQLLGRPFSVSGTVVHGRSIGRSLDAPTANLAPSSEMLVPADGVYAGRARTAGEDAYLAAISVGPPPMFSTDEKPLVEAHLLDFDGDLYDSWVSVEFTHHLRDHRVFDDQDALAVAIGADVTRVRELLAP